MAGFLDDLVPDYIGKQNIKLTLARPLEPQRAFYAVDVDVELLAEALTSGLVVPLELTVTSPSRTLHRKIYRRVVPPQVSFTPQEGGKHLVRLRETAHNSWWGYIVVDVLGEKNT